MMLDRNLREDRHPRHAAEVRENIVPSMLSFLSVLADSDYTKFTLDSIELWIAQSQHVPSFSTKTS